MDKRYQVFVSSTYIDLIEERKEVTQAILKCDCFPAGMELFPASSRKQWTLIKQVIDDSDFYLLIVAGRYGSLGTDEDGKKISYTEMEFNYAVSTRKPIIVLLHRDPDSLLSKFIEKNKASIQRLEKFREKAANGRMVAFWENKDQLHSAVLDSLHKAKRDAPEAIGWIRADSLPDSMDKTPTSISDAIANIPALISKLEKMDSYHEQIKYLRAFMFDKTLFNDERFIRYFLRFLNVKTSEANIRAAIYLLPYDGMDDHIKGIILAEANIMSRFRQLCAQSEHQTANKVLIHTISLLQKIKQTGTEYSTPIFNVLKMNALDSELREVCMNYCKFLEGGYRKKSVLAKSKVDYALHELENENRLLMKSELVDLLMSTCKFESDLVLIHDVFFKNDREVKGYVLNGLFSYCGVDLFIKDPKMQRLFFDICQEVYSWNNDYCTSALMHYCLFFRTDDIFLVDEIYEKVNSLNDDAFYLFIHGLYYGEFNSSEYKKCYELYDYEKERIRDIIIARKHPREKRLLADFGFE